MKKENVMTLILVMGLVIFCSIIYINNTTPIDEDIYNSEWYHFDSDKGFYNVLSMNNKGIYLKGIEGFDKCKKYNYNEKSKIFDLDCDKEIFYVSYDSDELVLKINEKEMYFFKSIDEAYNYEFHKYFGMSESEFNDENSQVKSLSLIDYESLVNMIENENFAIMFYGNECINTECYIFDQILEKLIVKSSNIYTFNANKISNKQISEIYKYDEMLGKDANFYNSSYPRIVIFESGKVKDTFLVNCDGFDCSEYYDLFDNLY